MLHKSSNFNLRLRNLNLHNIVNLVWLGVEYKEKRDMGNEIKYKEIDVDLQSKAFMDIIKSAYERGTTDSSLSTQEFVEEIKLKLISIYS